MSELCKWLHLQVDQLPMVTFPFSRKNLPKNGIYFFYECGEFWGHGGAKQRIVRVGTHRDGNFANRISSHYLNNDADMDFGEDDAKPSDWSIFRKNIGRAILSKTKDSYIKIWDQDFIKKETHEHFKKKRDIEKEKRLEAEITKIIRKSFTFRFVIMEAQANRMGSQGLESPLIGTLASCELCGPSQDWMGNYSPKNQIRRSGLWLIQHLRDAAICETDKDIILQAIQNTKRWLSEHVS